MGGLPGLLAGLALGILGSGKCLQACSLPCFLEGVACVWAWGAYPSELRKWGMYSIHVFILVTGQQPNNSSC